MKPIVLVAFAPLALAACNFGAPGGNTTTANTSAPAVTPDSVTVNGVVYDRRGSTPSAAPTIPAASGLGTSTTPSATPTPPPISDGSSTTTTTPSSSGDLPPGGEAPTSGTSSHGG